MKLVEILARELGEWPEDAKAIAQDADACAHPYAATEIEYADGEWSPGVISSTYDVNMAYLATDHATAIVTREMWEAERAKLQAGDGLPPIGAQVMFENHQCEVVGYHDGMVVCAMDDDYENGCYDGFSARDLRPIPTDREKWIEAAMNYWDHEMPRVSLEHIYDAGLAKLPD